MYELIKEYEMKSLIKTIATSSFIMGMVLGGYGQESSLHEKDGNVGIGTIPQNAKLHVKTTLGNSDALRLEKNGKGLANIYFHSQGINSGIFQDYAMISGGYQKWSGAGMLTFSTRKDIEEPLAEKVRITNKGEVGIGVKDPSSQLHVVTNSENGLCLQSTTQGLVSLAFRTQGGNEGIVQDYAKVSGGYQKWSGAGMLTFSTREDLEKPLIEKMRIINNGNVGIGTDTPDHKLDVNGTIRAKEVIVETGWADYVFEPDYPLMPLDKLEKVLKKEKSLPNIPSAAEVEKDGISVGEMNKKLLEKIEELTLYVIDIYRSNQELNEENTQLQKRVRILEKKMEGK